jgi:uncharacterized protein YukE
MDTREALSAAFDKVEAAQTDTAAAVTTEAPAVSTEAPAETTTAADRARDELGRFAAKTEPVKTEAAKIAPPVEPAPEVIAAPKSWKKEYHDYWGKLDPAVQKYVNQREEEFHRGIGDYKSNAELGQQFMEAARPYEAVMRSLNVSPVQAFQALANADYTLRTADAGTKARLFAQLAQQYGVSLDNIQSPPEVDQNTQQMLQTIQELRQQVQQLQGSWNGYQQQSVQSEIEQFASKPHFEELRADMAQLLNGGIAANLQEAYDKALRLNESLYAQVTAAQQREAQEQRLKEQAQAAAKAKAAAVQVTGGPSTASPETPRDRRSALEAAFDQFSQ